MRRTKAIGLVLLSGLTFGLGCQWVAGVDGKATFEPGTGGAGGNGGNGGTGIAGTSASSSSSSSTGMGGSVSPAGSGGMGGNPGCTTVSDCIAPECKTAIACDSGVCMFPNTADGTKVPSQFYGDCQDRVCDGNGGIKLIPGDPTKDTYDWANPCYLNGCQAFPMPLPWPDMPIKMCTTPWGNSLGRCSFYECIECKVDTDCGAYVCRDSRCIPPQCDDGAKNGMETGIDCGGLECLPCAAGKACTNNGDCAGTCDMGTMLCLAPSCSDGRRNSDEADIDCGGACAKESPPKKCADFLNCLFPSDCQSGVCKSGTCSVGSCNDQTQNQGEQSIDCGGPCAPCVNP